jgi:endonuclease/exonuclease/phosphatase family metal-dependent hydrolase
VTVAVLNAHGRGPRWRHRRRRLVEEITRLDLDAIALQELRTWPSQGRWLGRALTPAYAFTGARKRGWRGYEGVGVLTRLPILEREVLNLGEGGRVAVRCRLAAGEQAFDFYSAHFQHGGNKGDVRLRSAERVLDWIAANGVPAVLAGDLNGPPESRALKLLQESMRSAHVCVHGCEPTGTARPLDRGIVLDYILVSDGIEVVDARVAFDAESPPGQTISDHIGLVAKLRLGTMAG